jgi:hypothetical protein
MTDETETAQLPRVTVARKRLSASELEELRELCWELPSAAEGAAELLGKDGALPSGMRMERFMEEIQRAAALIVEIDTILSR